MPDSRISSWRTGRAILLVRERRLDSLKPVIERIAKEFGADMRVKD